MRLTDFIDTANKWGKEKEAFFFLLDFELEKPVIYKLDETANHNIFFNIKGFCNYFSKEITKDILFQTFPIPEEQYKKAFERVQQELQSGNTYLLNLTFPTRLEGDFLLEDLFHLANAPYKLLKTDDFVLYSPESFVRISENTIRSFPMKGTIDANIPDARQILLYDEKELYEHNTIVDLIRNDLAIVSKNIEIKRFRYIDLVHRPQGDLLQVSSEIGGILPDNWQHNIGDILVKLLPAGSISGAPKQKTCEIIRSIEIGKRGYYTGVFGVFDGENLDSAVNIRYVEKVKNEYFYKSGGGITALSNCNDEYDELIAKIYVPTAGNNQSIG